jgi:hypothetical protein
MMKFLKLLYTSNSEELRIIFAVQKFYSPGSPERDFQLRLAILMFGTGRRVSLKFQYGRTTQQNLSKGA